MIYAKRLWMGKAKQADHPGGRNRIFGGGLIDTNNIEKTKISSGSIEQPQRLKILRYKLTATDIRSFLPSSKELWRYIKAKYFEDGCLCCKEQDQDVLLFHHKERSKKVGGIPPMIQSRFPLEMIEEEIKKCAVVCMNCHHRIHIGKVKL